MLETAIQQPYKRSFDTLNLVVLSGGVGGAKLVEGLAAVLNNSSVSRSSAVMTVLGNIGDDDEFHGLWVSPDIDIVTYTLAGLVNRDTGWGFADETFNTLQLLQTLGSDTWMTLGDRDFAVHIYRTQQRRLGKRPTQIAHHIAQSLGVDTPIVLPTDDIVTTRILTPEGWLNMETFFVKERCQPDILAIEYQGAENAQATPEALAAINKADVILLAPSNPLVSIGPILSIPGIAEAVKKSNAICVAMSPLIGGRAIKGPAADMLTATGYTAGLSGVAEFYCDLADVLVIDEQDASERDTLLQVMNRGETSQRNKAIWVQPTLMPEREQKCHVASVLMDKLVQYHEELNRAG